MSKKTRSAIFQARTLYVAILVGVALNFQNCAGVFSVPTSGMSQASSASAAQAAMAPVGQVRRISMMEYRNSLQDIMTNQYLRQNSGWAWMAGIFGDEGIQDTLSSMPADFPPTKLASPELSMTVNDDLFSGYMGVANAFANAVISSPWGGITNFSGCAASSSDMTATCIDQFITQFGTLAFRAPPTADERAELKAGITDWSTLIARILVHPRFLNHIERDGTVLPDGTYQLTGYEIEARMASLFWKSAPDVAGLATAASGALSTSTGRRTEALRLLADQRAKDVMWTFYQQYLGTTRLPVNYGPSSAAYGAFSAPLTDAVLNQYPAVFHASVLQDARYFLEYLTFGTGTLSDVYRSPLIFTTDANVANNIYGVGPRADASAPPITDATGHFGGILTRPVITEQIPQSEGDTNHIQRGVLILSNIAGITLGAPSPSAFQVAGAVTIPSGSSTRVQQVLQTGATSCQTCHQNINPAGFALAHYDTLGRYQMTERRYVDTNGGATFVIGATNPIDSTAYVSLNGTFYAVSDVPSLVNALFNSGVIYDGFAKYYFSFAFGRTPTSSVDLQLLTQMKTDLHTLSIMDALVDLTQQPSFVIAAPPTN